MELPLSETETRLLNKAIAFAQDQVAPHAQSWEDEGRMPVETLRAACAAGFAGLEVPEELGGAGGRFRLKLRLAEEMSRHCFAFTFSLINHMGLAGKIARDAPEHLARRYLPEMLSGAAIGCTALSEPGAGSDFPQLRQRRKKSTMDGY